MASYEFHHVDVFTTTPFEGNPLAVVLTPDELPTATMQRVANEFNLSETVFIRQTDSETMPLRLRIFTPLSEMAFAGHPTIGAAFVAHREGMLAHASFACEENIGAVPVTIDDENGFTAWLTTPPVTFGARVDNATAAAALGLSADDALVDVHAQTATAGSPFLYLPLVDEAAVDRASGDDGLAIRDVCREAQASGVYAFAMRPNGVYSRMFAPEIGIVEDPATGGATGPLAAYVIERGLLQVDHDARFIAEQGTKMGRRSLLHVRISRAGIERRIEVGGSAVHVMEGSIAV